MDCSDHDFMWRVFHLMVQLHHMLQICDQHQQSLIRGDLAEAPNKISLGRAPEMSSTELSREIGNQKRGG